MSKKLGIISLILVIALAITGVGIAKWSDNLTIDGTVKVNTGNFCLGFISCTCSDNETGKNVGNCECELVDANGDGEYEGLDITISNSYPCYEAYVDFEIENQGSVPAHIDEVTPNNPNPDELAVNITELACTELDPLDPGERVSGRVTAHVLQSAAEGATYTFTMTINGNFSSLGSDTTSPTVQVITPTGGEIFQGGTNQPINWNATDDITPDSLLPITIEYSDNNGASWNLIVSGEDNDGGYTWAVPNTIDTNQALIKVSTVDQAGNPGEDVSDATFTIDSTPPTVEVTRPAGGEYWQGGSTEQITWNASDNFGVKANSIKIEYSSDGTTWYIAAEGEANDGSYNWTVANFNTFTANIRVTAEDIAGNIGSDDSDDFAVDSINPFVEVIAPDGGEQWVIGSSYDITWYNDNNMTPNDQLFNTVEYSTDGGSSWNLIDSGNFTDASGNGSYTWTVPDSATTNALVRVSAEDLAGNSFSDVSDAAFTITAAEVTTSFDASRDSFVCNGYPTSNYGDESYLRVGLAYTRRALVGFDLTSLSGATIISAELQLYKYGEVTRYGSAAGRTYDVYRITGSWTELGVNWYNCPTNNPSATDSAIVPGNGNWMVWDVTSDAQAFAHGTYTNYGWLIKDAAEDGGAWYSISSLFSSREYNGHDPVLVVTYSMTPQPYVQVASPNGGESWAPGNSYDITWTAIDDVTPAGSLHSTVELSRDSGSTWETIASDNFWSGVGNEFSYNWMVTDPETTDALIRVSVQDGDGNVGSDVSDAVFSIVSGPQTKSYTNDANVTIPDNDGWVYSSITVPSADNLTITNIDVYVGIEHTYIGDLQVELVSPDGTEYRLHNREGWSADDIYKWYTNITTFNGEDSQGEWRLYVRDRDWRDTGYINTWTLQITGTP